MKTVRLKLTHDPYTVETTLACCSQKRWVPIGEGHLLSPILRERLFLWSEPHDDWPGFFQQLPKAFGASRFHIDFRGLRSDFERLDLACKRWAGIAGIQMELTFCGAAREKQDSPAYKLAKLRRIQTKILDEQLPMFWDYRIMEALESVLNGELELYLTAPKAEYNAAVHNVLAGRSLLPNRSENAYSIKLRTRLDNEATEYSQKRMYYNGVWEDCSGPADRSQVAETLNAAMESYLDPRHAPVYYEVSLKGPALRENNTRSAIASREIKPVIRLNAWAPFSKVYVPRSSLRAFSNMNLIVYTFRSTELEDPRTREELSRILEGVTEALLEGGWECLLQDHMIFLCDTCEDTADSIRAHAEQAKNMLARHGLTSPRFFLIDSGGRGMDRVLSEYPNFSDFEALLAEFLDHGALPMKLRVFRKNASELTAPILEAERQKFADEEKELEILKTVLIRREEHIRSIKKKLETRDPNAPKEFPASKYHGEQGLDEYCIWLEERLSGLRRSIQKSARHLRGHARKLRQAETAVKQIRNLLNWHI